MGLDTSHGAFSGSYSAFNRLRQCVAEAAGGSYPPHYVYGQNGSIIRQGNGSPLLKENLDENIFYFGKKLGMDHGLAIFLSHSDCDGKISPEECKRVADALEELVPAIESLGWVDTGHIAAAGGYVAVTKRFIAGCRDAAQAGEDLEFF